MKTTQEIRAMVAGNDLKGAICALAERLDDAEETLAIATFEEEAVIEAPTVAEEGTAGEQG